ncbi:hypothetical protein OVA24_16325 [Luteolibacter sp. SL250]|uniref:hypothetical protein n=1 Tax=Luteolibacter sp. SL250 TaxID=2995170 RepID=UPI0022707A68|nr:hypothetical protein [Luteolibacter sp. SL250]WAC18797.1 hypothetical protein OVA24_16325 [Luteolibacter sp. SL250]
MARASLPYHAATHVLAAALGYAVFTMVPVDGGKHRATENGRPAMKVARDRGAAGHAGETEAERLRRGEAVLAKLLEKKKELEPPEPPYDDTIALRALIELADKTPPAADPAEEVRKVIRTAEADMTVEIRDMIGVRCLHWLRKDPAAAIAFLSDPANVKGNGILGQLMVRVAIAALTLERGWRDVLPHFPVKGDPSIMISVLLVDLQRETKGVPFSGPAGQAAMEDFSRLAVDAGATEALDVLIILGPDGVRWLDRKVASGGLPLRMLEKLEHETDYLMALRNTPGVPLERRLWMGDQPDERSEVERITELADGDVVRLLEEGRDWHYALLHGGVTADEILEHVRKGTPELAEKHAEELQMVLFARLMPVAPQEAMRLLEHLPEEQRWKVALEKGKTPINDPVALLSFMRSIPDSAAEGLLEQRSQWWAVSMEYHGAYSPDEVVSWLEELPAGRERDLAAFQLLAHRHGIESGSGAVRLNRLAASIRDPQVLELMKAEGGGE